MKYPSHVYDTPICDVFGTEVTGTLQINRVQLISGGFEEFVSKGWVIGGLSRSRSARCLGISHLAWDVENLRPGKSPKDLGSSSKTLCEVSRVSDKHVWNVPTWVLPEDYCKKDPCNFNTEMFVSKVGQPMSGSWSTSSQPDLVQALARRKTVRFRPSKILSELLKSWPTLGQLLANSPLHGKLQGPSLQQSSGNTRPTRRVVQSAFSKPDLLFVFPVL